MAEQPSIVLKFGFCEEPTCGTYGVARYWADGSFRVLQPACWHKAHSVMKSLGEIRAALERQRAEKGKG
jgi:hypothetical protein